MTKKKLIGTIIAIIIIIVGSFAFIHHEKQIALANGKAETAAQAKEAKANQLKEEQASKEAQTKEQAQTTNPSSKKVNQPNHNLSQEKNQLLNELSTLKPDISPNQHYGILTQSELLYANWDNELNKIWGILENNLPADQMQALRENEVQWIKTKDPYMPAYKAAGSGNYSQIQSVQAGQTLAQMTKDRCYYLINHYM